MNCFVILRLTRFLAVTFRTSGVLEIFPYPLMASFEGVYPLLANLVRVRPAITLTFLDVGFFDQGIQVRVEPSVVDRLFVIRLEFVFHVLPRGVVLRVDDVEEIALKPGEVAHLI